MLKLLACSITTGVVVLALLTSRNSLAETPWQSQETIITPWGHQEKMEARESWFRSLSVDRLFKPRTSEKSSLTAASPLPSEAENSIVAEAPESAGSLDIPEQSDLSEIPWQTYEKDFPDERVSSKFLWPIEGGRMTSGYGFRKGRVHEGIDIAAPFGSSIRSVADGRVVFSGHISGYGRILVIYHGKKLSTVYAHNSLNLKKKGDRVRQGETIAYVGKTGEASGTHCHFEVREEDGRPTNPLRFRYIQSPLYAKR